MMRVALHTRLKPGAEAAYEEAHRSVPEALTDAIRAAGVHSWTIWRSGIHDYSGGIDAELPVVWRL